MKIISIKTRRQLDKQKKNFFYKFYNNIIKKKSIILLQKIKLYLIPIDYLIKRKYYFSFLCFYLINKIHKVGY